MMGVAAYAGPPPQEDPNNPICRIHTHFGDILVELFPAEAPKTVENFILLAEGQKEFLDTESQKKVKRPYYDGLIFHRIIKDFMIQGGCPLGTGSGGPGYAFEDEINAGALGLDKIKAIQTNGQPHPFLLIRSQQDFYNILVFPLARKMNIKTQAEFDAKKNELIKKIYAQSLKKSYENLGYRYSDTPTSRHPKQGVIAMANSGPNTNGSQFFITLVDTPWLAGKHTVFGKVIQGMKTVNQIGSVTVNEDGKPEKDVTILSIRIDKGL